MTIIIDSPPELNEYFASGSSQAYVYGIFDGLVIVGWHLTRAIALRHSNGLPVEVIYKDMKG